MPELSFSSRTEELEVLLGLADDQEFAIDIFRQRIENPAGDAADRLDNFFIAGDFQFGLELGLELDLLDSSLGSVAIDYPVNAELVTPIGVSPGDDFTLTVADDFLVQGATLDATSLGFGGLALDFFFLSDGATFENISLFNTFFGSAIELPDIAFDPIAKTDIRLFEIGAGGLEGEITEGLDFSIAAPEGRQDTVIQDEAGSAGDLASLALDVRESLLNVTLNPIELLANAPFLANFPAFRALDLLKEDFDFSFTAFNTLVEASFGYTILSPFIAGGFDLVQTFRFEPTDVEVTYDVEGAVQTGSFRADTGFTAPEVGDAAIADGTIDGTATFDLEGQLFTSIRIVPTGSIGVEVLAAEASIAFDGGDPTEASFGPLFTASVSGDLAGFEILSDQVIPLPDDFFDPVSIDFSIDIVDPVPPEIENLPEEVIVPGGKTSVVSFGGARILDGDTADDIRLDLTVSAGTLVTGSGGGVGVLGSGTNAVTLIGRQEELTAFLNAGKVSFNADGVTADATLTLVADDQEGFPNTPLGSLNLKVLGAGQNDPAINNGSGAPDRLDAFDLDADGEPDENAGERAVAFAGGGGNDTLLGGFKADVLSGGSDNDSIRGNSGDDTITGGAGNDTAFGQADDDDIDGGAGDDFLDGGEGIDFIEGRDGADTLIGGGGGDVIFGGDDPDTITGDSGDDILFGGEGDDVISSGGDEDFVSGEDGNDRIFSGDGDDIVFGGIGNDSIETGWGSHFLSGDLGDDTIRSSTEAGDVSEIDGGEGNDSLTARDGNETIVGGDGADILRSGNGDDLLEGGDGNDTLDGTFAFETLGGILAAESFGADTLFGDDGDDRLQGRNGDFLDGGDGNDLIEVAAGSADDTVIGGDGNDTVFANPTGREFDLGDGNDSLTINQAGDPDVAARRLFVEAGAGDDFIDLFGRVRNLASEREGADIFGGQGNDTVFGTPFVDQFVDLEGDNRFFSASGDPGGVGDMVRTGAGNDDILTSSANDLIISGDGNDTISSGSGADTIRAGDGDDNIRFDHVFDTDGPSSVEGGIGNDTISGPGIGLGDRIFGGDGNDDVTFAPFGVSVDGGEGTDLLIFGDRVGDQIGQEVFSITFDLGAGQIFDNFDQTSSLDLSGIEILELTNRFIFNRNVADIAGLNDELDLALTLLDEGATSLPSTLDVVLGGNGNDTIANGAGRARLEGRDGDDFLIALLTGEGSDPSDFGQATFFDGGAGADIAIGGFFNDTIVAAPEDIALDGRGGRDLLTFEDQPLDGPLIADLSDPLRQFASRGEEGFAIFNFEDLRGRDGGDDTLLGNDDTRLIEGLGGDDLIGLSNPVIGVLADGGDGEDTLALQTDKAVKVFLTPTLANGQAFEGTAFFLDPDEVDGFAELRSIENLVTGGGDDEVIGGADEAFISTQGGDDTVTGGAGDETITGGAGNDSLSGGGGNDRITGGDGNDTLNGGAGADRFIFLQDFGLDLIEDFSLAEDQISIVAARPEDVRVEDAAGGAVLSAKGTDGAVFVAGVTAAALAEAVNQIAVARAPGNVPPDARDDAFGVEVGDALTGDVLADNGDGADFDPEGAAIIVSQINGAALNSGAEIALPSGALLTMNADGQFTYDQNGAFADLGANQSAEDTFTYGVSDGTAVSEAIVTIEVSNILPTVGTPGADRFNGSGQGDVFRGLGGADFISGAGGADTLSGDGGGDTVVGGAGGDILNGGAGNDQVRGGGGADRMTGGGGRDQLIGGGGNDRLVGGAGADTISGGVGRDQLTGGGGADRLIAGGGADRLTGGGGADRFVFTPQDGTNLVTDFRNGADKIGVQGVAGFGGLNISEAAGDAVIRFRGTTIRLDGVDSDLIDRSDFVFGAQAARGPVKPASAPDWNDDAFVFLGWSAEDLL